MTDNEFKAELEQFLNRKGTIGVVSVVAGICNNKAQRYVDEHQEAAALDWFQSAEQFQKFRTDILCRTNAIKGI